MLFERAVGEYADVKFRNGTVGETTKSELYDSGMLLPRPQSISSTTTTSFGTSGSDG